MKAFFVLLFCPLFALAQSVSLTLDECIDYALGHNTQVLQTALQLQAAKVQLQGSRYQRLPNLNASFSQGFGFGRSQGRDGSTEDVSSANSSFSISTSVPLFTGFRLPNELRANRERVYAAEQHHEKQRRDVAILVTTYYINALYYQGLVHVAEQKLRVDSLQLMTARALVEAGRRPQSEQAEAEANLATSQYELTTNRGNCRLALLDLRQAINYEGEGELRPAAISDEAGLAELLSAEWIDACLNTHPSVLAAMHELKASEYQQRIAKAGYYPTVDFSAGYSNSYYHSYDSRNMPFGRQLKLNGSEYLGFTLGIPIFNRFATRNGVRQAKLSVMSNRLQLDEQRRGLRKEIEQHRQHAINAQQQIQSALATIKACETSLQNETQRYAAGATTLYQLEQSHQRLLVAQNQLLQARCQLSLYLHTLKYYTSQPF